jgi:GTP:adenosylcobinamide-phosphate guanylyltransferase
MAIDFKPLLAICGCPMLLIALGSIATIVVARIRIGKMGGLK